jgi:hypothetical protein
MENVAAVVESNASQRQSVYSVDVHSGKARCVAAVNAVNRDRSAPTLPIDRRAVAVAASFEPQQPAA